MSGDVIACQGANCKNTVDFLSTPETTALRARYLGWRIFQGLSMAGTPLRVSWCPDCFERGTVARKILHIIIDGQMTLWDGKE